MLRVVVLLQLTLWVASIHAFFPWNACEADNTCAASGRRSVDGEPESARRAAVPSTGVTFDLYQRTADSGEVTKRTGRIARIASRLSHKHAPSQALRARANQYSVITPLSATGSKGSGVFQDGSDFSYFIQVKFGSAGKPLYMLVDSGAGTTWVMGSTCKSEACGMHDTFGPEDSKTFKDDTKNFSISYGSGVVSGKMARDTLAVAGMSVDMLFGIANDTSSDFTHFPFDGILGLSMSSGATDNFMGVLSDKKVINSRVFSVNLGRSSDGINNGQITFGGVDPSKYTGDISYNAVSAKANGDWAIPLGDLGFDGKSSGVTGRLAYIDTGTSHVFGPESDVAALHKLIPGATSSDKVTYTVPCDTTKSITVAFSGVTYTMPPKDWITKRDNVCTSNVYGHEVVKDSWLFGDLFLKNVYAVFDGTEKRIGSHGETRANSDSPAAREEEDVGLLSVSTEDAYDEQDDAVIVHSTSSAAAAPPASRSPLRRPPLRSSRSPGSNNTSASPSDSDQSRPPRTPRTPNRVRFDLRPTIVDNTTTTQVEEDHYHHHDNARESFELDDEDPLAAGLDSNRGGRGRGQGHHHQRIPLLTGIEAPSVTVANTAPWELGGEDVQSWAEAERARPKSGLRMAFMNMANSIIGAGIIGQPYAFRQAGLLSGILLLVGLTVVVDWTICLIVINSKLSGASSFQGTVEKCFGRPGLVAISVAQWAFAFGGMVAFGVIVGDSIPHMPVLGLLADRRAVIVVFTLALAKASTLALGALAPKEARGEINTWKLLVVNDGIFQAIGVISFAFVCHHNSLLIYGSLEKPTIDRFSRVTHYSTGVSMLACLLMALAGFLTFGDKTLGNVLNNFSGDNTMVNIARLCFGLNMLTTLPLEAFVCREVMLNYYFPGEPFNMNLHLLFTTSLVVSAMVLSLLTCDLGTVFELVGATSAAAMAYILPPLCYIKLTTRSWKTYVAWAVVVFGCAVMGVSMIQAVGKMIRGEGGTAQCM
ncbi:acid protease [Echria macrotheca]|uniref:Acid protease n=1 Tax=Echria macrotheca TaxID=438768 RepID=A0AAJ0F0E0_9PEZI|nr:acid protease [Echria macrotheca]